LIQYQKKGENLMNRGRLIQAANGQIPCDLVIKNVQLVNVFTKEIYPADIGISEGYIAHVTQPGEEGLSGEEEYDAKGKYAIPGMIDTHIHIESTMMNPTNFAKAVLPHGTTTVVNDPHELANVLGLEGVKYILEASAHLPLRFYVLAPSCVPSALGVETSGAAFNASEIATMLEWERVIGLAEVMDFPGVIYQSQRMNEILEVARKKGGFLQGHVPFLTGRGLSAYQCSGVNSDHESIDTDEAIYKLRAGMVLECRESSIAQNIKALAPALKACNYPPNATLCTDDREPDDLLREGHLDHVIRRAVQEGIPVLEAIKMCTYNAAQLTKLYDRGALAAGHVADVVLVEDLTDFKVNEVFIGGKLVAKEGKMAIELAAPEHPVESRNTITLRTEPNADTFQIKAGKPEKVLVNVIAYDKENPLLTKLAKVELPVKDGKIDISQNPELAYIGILERHGKNGNVSIGLVQDLGISKGAIASTVSHDCHNLTIVGRDPEDMAMAAQELVKSGGGIVCVADGKVLAKVELPIAGLMSTKSVEELAPETSHLKETIKGLGLEGQYPLLRVATFALAVIPEVKMTDQGLVDVLTQKFIPILPE
jgi:adenine deaminase